MVEDLSELVSDMDFGHCRYKFTLFNELYFLVAGGTVWIGTQLQPSLQI